MMQMKAKYLWKVTWVNPDIEPDKGYPKFKVGDIYGTKTMKQHHIRCKKNKGFFHETEYYHRVQIERSTHM